jgi:hypothetical protein
MTLYTNGCSFTKYIRDQDCNHWPNYLAEMLPAEVINDAEGCGSNQRAFRKTYEHLLLNRPDLVIIQLTDTFRFEFYQHSGQLWSSCKTGPMVINDTPDKLGEKLVSLKEKSFTGIEEKYNYISILNSFKSLFEQFDMPHFFCQTSMSLNVLNSDTVDYFNKNFNWVYKNDCLPSSFWSCAPEMNPNDGHPTAHGNQKIAEWIYNGIKDRLAK